MSKMEQKASLRSSFIYRLTGNPFVDGGIMAICALSGKNDPQEILAKDLERSLEFAVSTYPKWQKLQYLFTRNCLLLHPSIKNKLERYEKYVRELLQKISDASSGDCSVCGLRDADELVLRQQYPLTGSGDLVNYFSFFEPGLALCPACIFALQFLPLYLVSNDGALFLVHSHNQRLMFNLARKALFHVRGQAAVGEGISYYVPFSFARNERYEFLVRLARCMTSEADTAYGRISIRLYSFMNSGQVNFINFSDLPTDIFVFIEKAQLKGLGKNMDFFLDTLSPGIYRALTEEKNITYRFLRRERRDLVGGWGLFELYLIEVEKMDAERIKIVKKVGENLYQYLQSNQFKRLEDLERVDTYGDLRMLLTRAQKEQLIWEIDDEPYLFPHEKDGPVRWKETQLMLLAYVYEKMHKDNVGAK